MRTMVDEKTADVLFRALFQRDATDTPTDFELYLHVVASLDRLTAAGFCILPIPPEEEPDEQ